jgi:hypothetical protein
VKLPTQKAYAAFLSSIKTKYGINQDHVGVDGVNLCFESAYILRMLKGLVITVWKIQLSKTLLQPYTSQFKKLTMAEFHLLYSSEHGYLTAI